MKLKTQIYAFGIAVLLLPFAGCKKNETDNSPDETTVNSTNAVDNQDSRAESETIVSDVTARANNGTTDIGGRTDGNNLVSKLENGCNIKAKTVLYTSSNKTVVVTYNDSSYQCDGRKRVGVITIKLISGNKWQDSGAVVQATFTDFSVTRQDGKNFRLTGYHNITNVEGGIIPLLASGGRVVHKVRGAVTMKLNSNEATHSWSVFRRRTYNNQSGVFYATIDGDTTVAAMDGKVSTTGVNRYSLPYTVATISPVLANTNCGLSKPTSGTIQFHRATGKVVTVQYGTDNAGNVVTSGCPSNGKIVWQNAAGTTKSNIFSY